MNKIYQVLQEVAAERERQDAKWGEQNHDPFKWLAILGEEVGEANKAAVEAYFGDQITPNYAQMREELIQISAVAAAMVESLDRNELSKP